MRDSQIAQSYIEYWTRLSGDPQAKVLAAANREAAPDPVGQLPNRTSGLYSVPDLI